MTRLPAILAAVAIPMTATRAAEASEAHVQWSIDVYAHGFASAPRTLQFSGATTTRYLPAGDVPYNGSVALLGSSARMSVVLHDRWIVPIFGTELAGAVGSSAAVHTSVDGSALRVDPWTTWVLGLSLPGFGVRVHGVHWMLQARVLPGISLMNVQGQAAAGATSTYAGFLSPSVFVRLDVEGCIRHAMAFSTCLFVAPSLYDRGVMSGGQVGLRMEFGP